MQDDLFASNPKSKILLTGATGFLGRHVLNQLSHNASALKVLKYALVRDVDAWHQQDWLHEIDNTVPIRADICGDPAQLLADNPQLMGTHCIYHLAGIVHHSRRGADNMLRINIDATLQMVRLAAMLNARLVFVSTSGTVGCFKHPDVFAYEDSPYRDVIVGNWPYYNSKIIAEKQATSLANELGVELIIVRPPAMFGPGDHRFRSTGHIFKTILGKTPFIPNGGIAFADIRDVAQALVAIGTHESPRPIYHTPGYNWSLKDFFGLLNELCGAPMPRPVPYKLAHTICSTADTIVTVANGKKSVLPDPVLLEMASHYWGLRSLYAQDLGYSPRPARQTIVDTIHWLRINHPEVRHRFASPNIETIALNR